MLMLTGNLTESCATITHYGEEKYMVQISSLYSLENIQDYYSVIDENTVVNTQTNKIKTPTKSKQRGYWYYTFQTKNGKQQKVPVHKINALAFIANKPYDLIEHIDDDKDNNNITNLRFSNHSKNGKSAFKNGCHNRNEQIFIVTDRCGKTYIGTSKEIAKQSNIPRSTIYYAYYQKNKTSRKIKKVDVLSG